MHCFTDTNGTNWQVRLTYGKVREIKAELGLDMLDVSEEGLVNTVNQLTVSIEQLVATGYTICLEQIKERGLEDNWHEVLDAKVIKALRDAIFEEWVDFFLEAGNPPIAELIRQQREANEQVLLEGMKRIRAMDTSKMVGQMIDKVVSTFEAGTPEGGAADVPADVPAAPSL